MNEKRNLRNRSGKHKNMNNVTDQISRKGWIIS